MTCRVNFLNCNLKQFKARDWDENCKIRCVIQLMKFLIEKKIGLESI